MSLEMVIAGITLVSLILYALMGGADFGGGVWDLLARGPRAKRQREVVADAIAPIWEANHVWLILIVVLLFTAWPRAFAPMMTALHIPLTVMLIGIVLRGTAFVFRKYDSKRDTVQHRWSLVFGISSLVTPVVQGMTLGALATGDIRVEKSIVLTGFFAGWLSPFAWACGVFALVLFAFLAATYLTLDATGEPEVQNDFRMRAIWSEVALASIAAVVFFTSREEAPEMFRGLTNWWAPWLLVVTSVCAVTALGALWKRAYKVARVAAIGQVTTILLGWCLAQYPHLIYPDLTIVNAAAPQVTLKLLVIALGVGSVVLLPSLYYLFKVFKGKERGE
ncbi:MAG: putative Cytochrome bd2, subunit [Verrucomicrobia bacterium]|jgi:cytochrome d ubiquinol oxidase subunit II|nr:putative Cytochrome bd2, subunit [Verrucomicrobiota bacterium]